MFKLVTSGMDILPYSNSLSWSSDVDTLGTQLSFDSIKDLAEGQVVSLYETDKELIRGIVIKKTDKTNTFSYVVQDYSFYLRNKTLKQFNNMAASECIKSLITDAYLVGNITDIPTLITQIYKDKTLDEIIEDILSKAQCDQGIYYFKEIVGNVLNVYRLEDMKIVPNIIVGDYEIESSIENMKNDISVISSEEKYNSIVASASDETKYSWYGKLSDTVTVDADNVAQALNIAINKLNELNKIEKSTTVPLVILDESVEIKANRYIYLHSGKLIGYYLVKSAKHSLVDGLHKCDVEIKLDIEANVLTSSYENSDLINQIISDSKNNSSDGGSNGIVKKALKWALDTANDDSVGYQLGAWGPNYYDCSHFVITAYRKAGLSLSGASYTGDMYNAFIGEGFKDVTSSVNLSTGEGLQPGDVLLNVVNHTEMYSGNGKMVGARTSHAAFADQVQEHNYRNYPWDYVLRYESGSGEDISGGEDASGGEKMTVDLSFYTGAADEGGNMSASGKTLKYGMCASNVYSFGTKFKIVGINGLDDGVFTVEDRGGSDFNNPNRLDIYVGNDSDSKSLANKLGRQTCTAYKLN